MESVIIIVHIVIAIGIIALVLIQQGKGAEAGASFGGGASQTVFGSAGSGNFLTRATSFFAVVFFATSFSLAYFAKERATGIVDAGLPSIEEVQVVTPTESEVPVLEQVLPESTEAPVVD
ncbi:preprotein translocase subunit SecG [Bermanella sp. 47_1433_sub80_T6]|nr:preprotein translocase subunit SecG [Bermanella sp. 47_1433_sub80_T6]